MKSRHNPEYRLFIDLLKETRSSRNLTQAELATLLDVDQTYISKYENLERRLDVVELKNICKALDISLQKFIAEFQEKIRGIEE